MQAGTGAQPTLTFYNSAGLFLNESGYSPGFYLFAYSDSAYTVQNQAANDGVNYTTYGTSDHNVQHGDYFSSDRVTKYTVNNKVFYSNFNMGIGDQGVTYTVLSHDIPIFTDIDEFVAYTMNPAITYQWSSVPTISGKMGTLSLTEILNINDGEAVDDVALSGNISLSASSALDALIDAVVQEDSNVTVSYSIPDETYSYIKLVYKKDRMPTSPSDGTAITIAQSSTSQVISGIADGSTYWFTIFTDISESDPVSFDTVRTSWLGEEVILLYSGNSNTMTAQISDGHILFKLYSGETVIYSFNAYAGSTVSDANKIYVQFLKDDTNEIAKPSLVYFDGTNYSINQETPTDEQMADIYTWLQGGTE